MRVSEGGQGISRTTVKTGSEPYPDRLLQNLPPGPFARAPHGVGPAIPLGALKWHQHSDWRLERKEKNNIRAAGRNTFLHRSGRKGMRRRRKKDRQVLLPAVCLWVKQQTAPIGIRPLMGSLLRDNHFPSSSSLIPQNILLG